MLNTANCSLTLGMMSERRPISSPSARTSNGVGPAATGMPWIGTV